MATPSWPANYDRDNEQLTYHVIKNGNIANPVYTKTVPFDVVAPSQDELSSTKP